MDSVIRDRHVIALCTHPIEKGGVTELMEVVNHHRFAIIKRKKPLGDPGKSAAPADG